MVFQAFDLNLVMVAGFLPVNRPERVSATVEVPCRGVCFGLLVRWIVNSFFVFLSGHWDFRSRKGHTHLSCRFVPGLAPVLLAYLWQYHLVQTG